MTSLARACEMFQRDLEALPDEAFDKSFGAATRTVANIVYEVNLVNDHIGMVLRGEQPFAWPEGGWIKAPADFQRKDAVLGGFQVSSKRILKTAASFSAESMEEPLETESGPTTRSERCRFMALHLWYHSGQLNFIQTLLGDDAWHWKLLSV